MDKSIGLNGKIILTKGLTLTLKKMKKSFWSGIGMLITIIQKIVHLIEVIIKKVNVRGKYSIRRLTYVMVLN